MASVREKVAAELENISQALDDLQNARARPERTVVERAALATFLHNIYSGFENIIKQILQAKGIAIPHTQTSHKDLVNLASAERIISQPLADDIFPFLTFRHFFVHAYGFMLEEDPLMKLVEKIPNVHSRFVSEIEAALREFENPGLHEPSN